MPMRKSTWFAATRPLAAARSPPPARRCRLGFGFGAGDRLGSAMAIGHDAPKWQHPPPDQPPGSIGLQWPGQQALLGLNAQDFLLSRLSCSMSVISSPMVRSLSRAICFRVRCRFLGMATESFLVAFSWVRARAVAAWMA